MSKTALCIGINNYPGTQMDLAGCVNDAEDWATELTARGFEVSKLIEKQATKAAMVAGMRKIIGDAAAGDTVVITFAGHGTYAPDRMGDEADGLDEGLCPYDIQTGGAALLDDELHALFANRKAGVKLVLISDSCHSGTVTRDLGSGDAPADLPKPRYMPMGNWMRGAPPAAAKAAVHSGASAFKKVVGQVGDLLLSGCEEGPGKYSYDWAFKRRPNGAFTYHALKALRELTAKKPGATYADWHKAITGYLPMPDCPQRPQIWGTDTAKNNRIFA